MNSLKYVLAISLAFLLAACGGGGGSAGTPNSSTTKTTTTTTSVSVPSAALAQVIGLDAAPRTEVIKKLWDYIKSKGLQDPKDKRKIVCDVSLQAVFGKPEVNMFELAGLIGAHLSAAAEA